jgi:esterase
VSFVPAARVVEGKGEARRSVWFLHGILGSARNWTTFARRLLQDLPGWRAVLVDLRNHGESGVPEGPDDLEACAADLSRLADQLGRPDALVGHSFGGKTALAWLRNEPTCAGQVWSLDSAPSAAGADRVTQAELSAVFAALRAVPQPLERREDVVRILSDRGLSEALGQWMTTNLAHRDGGYRWRFELERAWSMLEAYMADDLWPTVRSAPVPVHLVRAARSDRWTAEDLRALDALPATGNARAHLLPDAGHWLHVDNPFGLRALLLRHLR